MLWLILQLVAVPQGSECQFRQMTPIELVHGPNLSYGVERCPERSERRVIVLNEEVYECSFVDLMIEPDTTLYVICTDKVLRYVRGAVSQEVIPQMSLEVSEQIRWRIPPGRPYDQGTTNVGYYPLTDSQRRLLAVLYKDHHSGWQVRRVGQVCRFDRMLYLAKMAVCTNGRAIPLPLE